MLAYLVGDNSTVIGWINGEMACTKPHLKPFVIAAQKALHRVYHSYHVSPAERGTSWITHFLREGNKAADRAATRALTEKKSSFRNFASYILPLTLKPLHLRCSFDGGFHHRDRCGSGGVVIQVEANVGDGKKWMTWMEGSEYYQKCSGSIEAEAKAATSLCQLLEELAACTSYAEITGVRS